MKVAMKRPAAFKFNVRVRRTGAAIGRAPRVIAGIKAALLAGGLAVIFAQAAGHASNPVLTPLTPNPVLYSTGFLVNGDYAVGSVDITSASGFLATATIPMSGVPADADILSAFVYWETIAPSFTTPAQIANYVQFRGKPITSV